MANRLRNLKADRRGKCGKVNKKKVGGYERKREEKQEGKRRKYLRGQ